MLYRSQTSTNGGGVCNHQCFRLSNARVRSSKKTANGFELNLNVNVMSS